MTGGAIIADLAAWTYEHDKECFFRYLVSPDAKLSGYGLMALTLWEPIHEGGLIVSNRLYVKCGMTLMHAHEVEMPDNWRSWGLGDYDKPLPYHLKVALIIGSIICSGDLSEERQSHLYWSDVFHGGKQEYYANFIMKILRRLNEGKTKDEAITNIPNPVFNYYPSGMNHQWKELLEYTTFAWRCFYYSWDFSSALHKAARCPANRQLAMLLTGAFADAMYGCEYNIIKQKYTGKNESASNTIHIPKRVSVEYGDEIKRIKWHEYSNRIFFKKNEALTNVERQIWKDAENPYASLFIDDVLKSKIMRAYHTDWERRYGIYLDNGWFYVYRSHCLLFRFKIQDNHITHFQINNDPLVHIEDFMCVLDVLERNK